MTGKTHLFFGASAGVLGLVVSSPDTAELVPVAGFIGASMIGSIFPDIDNVNSTISKNIPLIPTIINKIFGHRGFFHSPLFLLMVYFLSLVSIYNAGYINYLYLLNGFTIGFVSHLILDMMTKGGIPIFYPFSKKRYSFTKMKTGSFGETIFLFIVSIIVFFIIFYFLNN